METTDVARDVKMKGEDLAHAYDAVRVANKSVHSERAPRFTGERVNESAMLTLSLAPGGQVSGEPAEGPVRPEGGGAGGSQGPARSSDRCFLPRRAATGTS